MQDFVRLNPVSESVLKVLMKHERANPDNLCFALGCDKSKLGKNLAFLMEAGYVSNSNPNHAGKVYGDDSYRITIAGENYLSSLDFYRIRDKRQFIKEIVIGTTSLVALIKAFWNEISAIILR